MKILGNIEISGIDMILAIDTQKSLTYYYLYSKYHMTDRANMIFGKDAELEVMTLDKYAYTQFSNDYLVACIVRKNIGGELSYKGNYKLMLEVIETIQSSLAYAFKLSDIEQDNTDFSLDHANIVRSFKAKDSNMSLVYEKVASELYSYSYESVKTKIYLNPVGKMKFPKIASVKSDLQTLTEQDTGSSLYYSNVNSIDYDAVIKSLEDVSWYYDTLADGTIDYKKDYKVIHNIEEFENFVITPLVEELACCRARGEQLILGLDTETTGLNVYNIPASLQSKIVSIPLSWKDNSGVLINVDMEYFENVPVDYIRTSLAPFLEKDILCDDDITIQTKVGDFTFKRSEILVVGHNINFDIRAFYTLGIEAFFDVDTMQMSFTLDPFLTKRKNGLKHITHKLLGCNTPELTDVLGKGNEDKFKYINDERLSKLYGCADGDFTRLVFKGLKDIFKQCEGFHGRDLLKVQLEQDILLMNALAKADYDGIRIDKDVFIEKGKQVLEDMEIITQFAQKYVGEYIAIVDYSKQITALQRSGVDISTFPPLDLGSASKYEFTFSGNSLSNTLFNVLQYPIFTWTEPSKAKVDSGEAADFKPKPAVNKTAMKKLMQKKHKIPVQVLKDDILGSNGRPLIEAEEFNSYKYPVAYLVSLIGPRKKEYASYFKAFVEDSYGDRLCKNSKFANIDTRRIANPTQTIKGSLKQYMLPYSDDYAMCDFDMSQVEIRIMASLAHDQYTIDKMKNPEADSHQETASEIFFKAAHLISAYERKSAKSVNFGYPYGLMRHSMCESIFKGEVTDENLAKTQRMIETFEKVKHLIVGFLNNVRKGTVKEIEIPQVLRNYLEIPEGVPMGRVQSIKGFYKLFALDDLTDKKAARIGRQSGNFPIQCFAADLFRLILIRAYTEFWRLGWMQKGWVKWHIVIHDELLLSFHKKHIHPVHLAAVIHRACTIKIKGHTNYYIGVNIGNTWGDCKDDARELPVYLVDELAKRWDSGEFSGEVVDDPQRYMDVLRAQYISDRIHAVILSRNPDLSKEYINCQEITSSFTNYTVRKYVYEENKPLWSVPAGEDQFDACLAAWALNRYGSGVVMTLSNGKTLHIEDTTDFSSQEILDIVGLQAVDKAEIESLEKQAQLESENEEYSEMVWDLGEGFNSVFYSYDSFDEDEDLDTAFDKLFDTSQGDTFESMRRLKTAQLVNIARLNSYAKIAVTRRQEINEIEKLVRDNNLQTTEGIQLLYRSSMINSKGSFISEDSLVELDKLITVHKQKRGK